MKGLKFAAQASALALGAVLAGCGDGGGVGSTPNPPATPATYTKLVDMTGNRTFQTGGVQYNVAASGFSGGVSQAFGSGVVVSYNASADSYQLTAPDGATQTFAPADVTGQPTPSSIQFVKVNGTTRDTLTLTSPISNGVSLSYTLVGAWVRTNTAANTSVGRIAVGGAPTLTSDMPKTGTANYTVGVGGSASVTSQSPAGVPTTTPYSLSGNSSGTFSADFGSGTLQTSLVLAGAGGAGGPPGSSPPIQNFGTFTGTGTLASGGPGFSGNLTGSSANGLFSGAFFGPRALEMGYGWVLSGPNFNAVGVTTGVKN